MSEHFKHIIDWIAGGTTVAALLAWVPHLTAVLALVWWALRIYETDTVQKWIHKKKEL